MKAVILVAALVCIYGVQGLSLGKRDACESYMTNCAAPLMAYGEAFNDDDLASQLANETHIDEVCSHLDYFTTCVSGGEAVCAHIEGLVGLLDAAVEIVEYICSAEGRELLRRVADSPCSHDPTLIEDVEDEFEACFEAFQYEVSMTMVQAIQNNDPNPMASVCPLVDGFRTCNVEGAERVCGEAFGIFVGRVWDTFSSVVMEQRGLDCTYEVSYARRFVRRAIGMVKRRV